MGSYVSTPQVAAVPNNDNSHQKDQVHDDVDVDSMPTFCLEHAKSGRSKCRATGCQDCTIAKHQVRVGLLNPTAGNYGKWQHLDCWQVPACVYENLPKRKTVKAMEAALLRENKHLVAGFSTLHPMSQEQVIAHILDSQNNWTNQPPGDDAFLATNNANVNVDLNVSDATRAKASFVLPMPGVDGAKFNSLNGMRFVLSGTFAELGDGKEADGKEAVQELIGSFGGRVNVAISNLTTLLIVGEEPGFKKVREARQRGIPILRLADVQKILCGDLELEAVENATIEKFSDGCDGKWIAKYVSKKEYQKVATGKGY